MENPKDILIRQAQSEEFIRRYVAASIERQIYGSRYRRTMRDFHASASYPTYVAPAPKSEA